MSGSFSTVSLEESEKYPPNIQKLFAPGLPIPYCEPIDYAIQERRTCSITPISRYRSLIDTYVSQLPDPKTSSEGTGAEISLQKARLSKQKQQESYERQLNDWNNPELLLKNEQEFMKDPYKTVFISRLDYKLTEIDISNTFTRFGPIGSIKIIRDHNSKSRGYGFIVFEKDSDAKTCIRELAPTGITIPGFKRTILVDMERGRVIRNWKPRRLGGGLGGRHYTKPKSMGGRYEPNASAAASGRRMNIPMNPYQDKFKQRPPPSQPYKQPPANPAYSSRSIKDKYSNYRSSSSIRQRE